MKVPQVPKWPNHCKGKVHVYRDSFQCDCKKERMDRRKKMERV